MDEIIPGLWIGDLQSAQNAENLKAHGIYSILSAMRGKIKIHETFIRHQVQLDDTEDADILTHFLPSIHFIQAELDKGKGVLVHCQAGVSRSSTIVAAYLMYSKGIDPHTALELIRKARPYVEPNQGFFQQLELFHEARYKISRREKAIRMFYMGRAVEEVMNGDGSAPETDMFAKYPRTPSDSVPNTPGEPRRRIRCKVCRQELATRQHMLDHGQLGPATPAANTPIVSRRPSASSGSAGEPPRRRPSRSLGDSLAMSSIDENAVKTTDAESTVESPTPIPEEHPLHSFRSTSRSNLGIDMSQSFSALEMEDEDEKRPKLTRAEPLKHIDLTGATTEDFSIGASEILGQKLSNALTTPLLNAEEMRAKPAKGSFFKATDDAVSEYSTVNPGTSIQLPSTHFLSPSELAMHLSSNPKLAALRSPPLPVNALMKSPPIVSAPILANPKCSGYFLEPMKWMDHFLSSGQLAGKITCPNKKCGAKLGNYDWAGQCCGCKEWVTPGFCINRSKVDEVV